MAAPESFMGTVKTMEPVNVAYNMDCMEYMRSLPDKAFDLAVVDPPYGDGDSQSVHAERERGWAVQPIRRLVEPLQRSTTDSVRGSTSTRVPRGGGITARTNTTWANPDRGNLGDKVRQKNHSVGHGPG